MFSRRGFLKVAGLLSLWPISSLWGRTRNRDEIDSREFEYYVTFSEREIRVVQGVTNADSTILTVVAHRSADLLLEVFDGSHKKLPIQHSLIDLKLGDFVLHQIFVAGLSLGEKYTLSIYNKYLSLYTKRTFSTLDWNRQDLKIALLSCANHRDAKPKATMFKNLFAENPDVLFFSGDLVYANSSLDTVMNRPANPEDAYNVYTKTLMEFELYEREQLIPIFSSWDDHDLAFNNAGHDHPYKQIMAQIFRGFFPVDARVSGIFPGPDLSFSFEAFGFQIFFFDCRSSKNNPAQKFLGSEQMDWFKSEIQKSSKPLLLIATQQFLNYRSLAESFQKNAAREFGEFVKAVRNTNRPTLLVSGDVHYSQIQELSPSLFGHKTYELTSSAFFSSSARSFGKRGDSSGQLAYYGYPNFLLLEEIKSGDHNLDMNVRCVSEKSEKQFSKRLNIKT